MRRAIVLGSAIVAFAASAGPLSAAETIAAKTAAADNRLAPGGHAGPAEGTYTLRYHFQPGETLRWKVIQRVEVTTTASGTTRTASTVDQSVKAWRIQNVGEDGTVTFQNSFESVST